ncbi:DUF1360 domain-containing protein [Streptomyces sp900116325]|uniref:DUF1360 domain-containing protein n=1 Tax=Streptomyces sp. 900116325 TaxID=3154295 RepID=UPI0033BB8CAA
MRKTKLPDRQDPWDVLFAAAATFRLSRLLSKGSVTSPIRAPFTRYKSATGPAEVSERPRGGKIRSGEFVTCPFCLSVWLTTTITGCPPPVAECPASRDEQSHPPRGRGRHP